MGRNICVFIVGLVLIGLAGEVRGQETLDTLWTRRIASPGNETIYSLTRASDGNILIAAYLDGVEGLPAGNYILLFTPQGDWFHSVPLTAVQAFSAVSDIRQTPSGEIEIAHVNRYFVVSLSGELLEQRTIPGEFREENSWPYPPYYSLRELTYSSARFWSDSTIAINGTFHTAGYMRNWGIQHSFSAWFGAYDIPTSSTCAYTSVPNQSVGAPLHGNCFALWSTQIGESFMTLRCARTCGSAEPTREIALPRNQGAVRVLSDSQNYPWLAWIGRPLIAVHMDAEDLLALTRTDNQAPNAVAFNVDPHDNLVSLSYATTASPWTGVRFDVIGAESGTLGETVVVSSLPNASPVGFALLEDNSAFLVSYIPTGNTRDLLVARTDTIPTGYYPPVPPSVELLVEGPPAWGYRIHSGLFSQNQIIFRNLCGEARGNMSGDASSRWDSGRANFSVFFTTDHALPTNSTSDTLWLTAPECESVDIAWSMNGVDGMVRGPFHPEVSLQTFSCQLEPFGVNARFDVAGATNMDSLQVWRKNATGTDSLLIGTKYAVAGHHVVGDHNVPVGTTWTYYLLGADRLGRLWSLQNASASIFADPTVIVPEDYQFELPYPNPFNASTTFSFDIPELSIVHLDIYDITGRLVSTLMDQPAPAGSYTKSFDASNMASGVYIYSFRANDFSKHGKVLLLK